MITSKIFPPKPAASASVCFAWAASQGITGQVLDGLLPVSSAVWSGLQGVLDMNDEEAARLERAEKALIDAGWTYKEGSAAWKPPLGKKPDFVEPSVLVFALETARMTLSRLLDGRVDPEGLDAMVEIDNLLAYINKPEWQFPSDRS